MKISIVRNLDLTTVSASELAAEYKFRGYEKYYAWDMFVRHRGLRPEMDAKDFYLLFDKVNACPINNIVTIDFTPTHYDNLLRMECQIIKHEKWYEIIWVDGSTGSNPESYPPEPERFLILFDKNVEAKL